MEARAPFAHLHVVAARYVLDRVEGEELVRAADALLDSGVYSLSLGELVTSPVTHLREVRGLFESALKELALRVPTPEEAGRTLIHALRRGVLEGRESPRLTRQKIGDELWDLVTWDRRLGNLKADVYSLYDWDSYDVSDLAELDQQFVERARSWMRQDAFRFLNPHWLSWNGGLVRTFAQRIAEDRTWDQLPILADALEEAGCGNAELIEHCRIGEKHANYCWLTDLLALPESVSPTRLG